jgi:hypothetical protein
MDGPRRFSTWSLVTKTPLPLVDFQWLASVKSKAGKSGSKSKSLNIVAAAAGDPLGDPTVELEGMGLFGLLDLFL